MSIAKQYALEQLSYIKAISSLDPSKHLKQREGDYVHVGMMTPGAIHIIKETEEGWWEESHDVKGNVQKQLDKFLQNPSVIYGWITSHRFSDKGGWAE